jgi:2-polyprenyl-6-hydroxyphenyl methylase/3-demethylubiquinone-9 3-methyltransferase
MSDKIVPCLWYDGTAEEAAAFYVSLLPDSRIDGIHRSPADNPSTAEGAVLVVEFTLAGRTYVGLNGGPHFKFNEAVSFQIQTEDQDETDRLWNAITGNGGAESMCGWCKDKWGLSWQITPRALTDALAKGGDVAKRAFEAMMEMQKIDIARIEAAVRGESV